MHWVATHMSRIAIWMNSRLTPNACTHCVAVCVCVRIAVCVLCVPLCVCVCVHLCACTCACVFVMIDVHVWAGTVVLVCIAYTFVGLHVRGMDECGGLLWTLGSASDGLSADGCGTARRR